MLRRNPDALALIAIVFFLVAAKAPFSLFEPARHAVVTPIRVEMQAQRQCFQTEFQVQRRALRQTIADSVREAQHAVADSIPFE